MTHTTSRSRAGARGLGGPTLMLLAFVLMTAGCGDKNPVQPRIPDGKTPVSMSITGNTSLAAPGETSQLTAVVTYSDGSTQDVTRQATWHPESPYGVVTISAGLLRALSYGRAPFTATYGARGSGVANVLPPGTFLLKGVVAEGGFALDKVAVEVTLATGARYQATTDLTGRYALPAAGQVTVRAEKAGYPALVRQLTIEHDEELNLDLRPPHDPAVLAGVYELAMIASPSCSLPPEYSRRTYAARIRTQGDRLGVEVAGADMEAWGDAGFTGVQQGTDLRFDIYGTYTYGDTVFVERVQSNTNLAYTGTARGRFEAGRITATLDGEFQLRHLTGTVQTSCVAADHRMEFMR